MDVYLQQVAERIYDAALDERLWTDLVETISRSFEDRPFYLLQADTRTRRTDLIRTANLDTIYAQEYLGKFSHVDSNGVGALQSFAGIGEVAKPLQLMSERTLRAQPVIQSVYEPVGVMPDWGTKLSDDQESIAACGFHRRAGQTPMSTEQIEHFLPLVPHFIRAARFMGRFRALNNRVSGLREGLDALGDAIFLVDEDCRLIEANAAAEKRMQEEGPVRLVHGRVTLRHPLATRTLRTRVRDAVEKASNRELALNCWSGGRLGVEIIPSRETSASPVHVVIVLRARDELLEHRLRALSTELRLSRRQSLVARHLVEGESYDEIADRLRCSVNSIKTHIRRLYEKANCRDRLGLLRILAQF